MTILTLPLLKKTEVSTLPKTYFFFFACCFLLSTNLIPIFQIPYADARAGLGVSMGSRGFRTWHIPASTRLSPHITAPIERSTMPRVSPSFTAFSNTQRVQVPFTQNRTPYQNRHTFLTWFVGSFLGVGFFDLLSEHGMTNSIHGVLGFIRILIPIGIIAIIIWFLRFFISRQQINNVTVQNNSFYNIPPHSQTPTITATDYQTFQKILHNIQTAWNQQNIPAMRQMATPEMVSYFREQLSTLKRQGRRNIVSDLKFLQGDLSEAWIENGATYATVALRYSMVDLTTNVLGQVVQGSSTHPVTVTEIWTFVRPPNQSQWFLSALQQTR